MIELSILDLLYLVLTFFGIVIGTLLTLVLIRILKILRVGVELTEYYYAVKGFIEQGLQIPQILKEKIEEYIASQREEK